MRKTGIIAFVMTLIGAVLVGLIIFNIGDLNLLTIFFVIWMFLWLILGFLGLVLLLRKGYIPFKAFAEYTACGCIVLVFFWWIIVIISVPGPYLLWYADAKMPKPQCPTCKRRLPFGVDICPQCGSTIKEYDAK
jgi:hypothetical protein